jgi:hypothetical protein
VLKNYGITEHNRREVEEAGVYVSNYTASHLRKVNAIITAVGT